MGSAAPSATGETPNTKPIQGTLHGGHVFRLRTFECALPGDLSLHANGKSAKIAYAPTPGAGKVGGNVPRPSSEAPDVRTPARLVPVRPGRGARGRLRRRPRAPL